MAEEDEVLMVRERSGEAGSKRNERRSSPSAGGSDEEGVAQRAVLSCGWQDEEGGCQNQVWTRVR